MRWVVLLAVACAVSEPTPEGTASPATSAPQSAAAAEALLARHRSEGASPEGALSVWLQAAVLHADDPASARAVLGELTLPFRDDPDWATRPSNRTFVDRLAEQPHVFRSYAVGATPENGYRAEAWALAVDHVEEGDPRGVKVFVRSGGADSPRPAYLKRSTTSALYYVNEFSSLYVGIRPIVDPSVERFE